MGIFDLVTNTVEGVAHRVDVMTLAKISGHRDLKILLNTYYRETAEEIAKRLG